MADWSRQLIGLVLALGSSGVWGAVGLSQDQSHARGERLEQIVTQRVAFYNKAFPQLQFVRLRGGPGAHTEFARLQELLGRGAASMDYEHPADLRGTLLQAVMGRVQIMLDERAASASLFRVGDSAQASQPYLCVLTLDAGMVAHSDAQATRHLLDLSEHTFGRVHPSNYLDDEAHLAFVVDHEVYHCLDAFYNGPVPMSTRTYAAPFAFFRNENGADAFGVAMHLREHGRATAYTGNLLRIRALALLSADPNHFTHAAIRRVLQRDPRRLRAMTPLEMVGIATQVRDAVAADYRQYVQFRIAAIKASRALGGTVDVSDQATRALASARDDPAVTNRLFYRALSSYRQLFVPADRAS